MFYKPRRKSDSYITSCFCFVERGEVFTILERRLDGLQEIEGNAITLVKVGDVSIEAGLRIVVSEEANIIELPAAY